MNFASPFSLCIVAMTVLALLGLPIGHAMIAGSIFYLLLAGLDLGTVAEQILNGLTTKYVLLAVTLFILSNKKEEARATFVAPYVGFGAVGVRGAF